MMMDTAWGVGAASAPTMTGCGNGSVGFPDSVTNGFTDDEIEDMIDDLGFFQDKDDNTTANAYSTNSGSGSGGWQTIKKEANVYAPAITKYATVSPAHLHLPIIRNCNDTATATATGAVVIVPNLAISTQRNCNARSTTNFPTTIASNATKDCNIALSQPPRLLTNQQSPVTSSSTAQTVLKQQQETILQNQKIIDAQRNELQGQQIHKTTCQPIAVASTPASTPASMPMPASTPNSPTTTKMSATYPLAHVALKKADEQIINGSKIAKGGTKRKVSSLSDGSPTEANAYQKWKLTPAGATKLRAVDSSGINHCRNAKQQHQEDVSGKHLNPGELEVRRERNRKHAKKSRLRKKSLTSTLEQSLEILREENTKLRNRIEDHIAKKKEAAATAAKSVYTLLEEHRVRSHERFIDCILSTATTNGSDCDSNSNSNTQNESKDTDTDTDTTDSKTKHDGENSFDTKSISSSGRGIIVDDKTLKILKGLSKSIAPGANKDKNQ